MSRLSNILLTASLASIALARTDLTGCTSTDVSSPAGASIAWYVPGTGELCIIPDCGGGRAPPKTTAPGCGSVPEVTSYLPGYGSMSASATSSTSSAEGSMSTELGVVPALTSTMTRTGAWSEASETDSALSNGANGVTSYMTASSSTMETVTSTPTAAVVPPVGGNGTATNGTSSGSGSGSGSGASGNGTSSASPSPIQSDSGAMATARVWLGGSALVGLGAIVAVL